MAQVHEAYNISVADLLKQYPSVDDVVAVLIPYVRSNAIWFPFRRYFMPSSSILIEQLGAFESVIGHKPYKLHSYYPINNSYLPAKFRGKPTYIENSGEVNSVDLISDEYNEHIRLKSKRYDQELSVLESWIDDDSLKKILKTVIASGTNITPESLRDAIYNTVSETGLFKPTWARALLKLVIGNDIKGKKWLDISAGWGDRLIAAISLNMEYLGFDPNTELQPGHSAIISDLGDSRLQRIIYEPFEKAILPDTLFDVILTSPPYFNLEVYDMYQKEQSTSNYPKYDEWMIWFLFRSLDKAWSHLKEGGYLILHLADAKTISLAEATNIFIENYLPGSRWEGIIGVQGGFGQIRPVWVWKKGHSLGYPPQRTLYKIYPTLYFELLRYEAQLYDPSYAIHRSNGVILRTYIASKLSYIPRQFIESTISDLMVALMLQTRTNDEVLSFFTTILSNYPATVAHAQIPNYQETLDKVDKIRDQIARELIGVKRNTVTEVLPDATILWSLSESIGEENAIIWGTAMVKIALHV